MKALDMETETWYKIIIDEVINFEEISCCSFLPKHRLDLGVKAPTPPNFGSNLWVSGNKMYRLGKIS